MKKSHLRMLRTSTIIITSILFYFSYSHGSQKSFQLPPLFQQHEIKGNHAGRQILAMGMLRQCMKIPSFREYARERVRSEVQTVVDHLVGHAKPSHLDEEGQIPSDRILSSNGVGDCSLYFHQGKYNIKRKGQIKRIPKRDIDSTLNQLDEKTIHNYLAVAKIGLSRCSDDSIMLRSQLGLPGGVWQAWLFNNIMLSIQFASRGLLSLTIGQAAQNYGQMAQNAYNQFRQGAADTVRPHLTEVQRQVAGQFYNLVERAADGAYFYTRRYFETPAEYAAYVAQNAAQAMAERGVEALRHGAQYARDNINGEMVRGVLGNQNVVGHLTEDAINIGREYLVAGASTGVNFVADVVRSQFPEATREITTTVAATATSWSWLFNLLEFTATVRF